MSEEEKKETQESAPAESAEKEEEAVEVPKKFEKPPLVALIPANAPRKFEKYAFVA